MRSALAAFVSFGVLVGACGEPPSRVEVRMPDRLVTVSDTVQQHPVATTLTVTVRAVDRRNEGMPNAEVGFSVVSGGGLVTALQLTTDRDGYTSASWRIGPTAGENVLEARVLGRAGPMTRFRVVGKAASAVQFALESFGNGVDPDGVIVSVGGWSGALEPGRTVLSAAVDAGTYAATLTGLAPHCYSARNEQTTTVAVAETTTVRFSIECYGDIAFIRHYSDRDLKIFYLRPDGVIVGLTPGLPGRNSIEDWSPDGARILFVNEYNGNSDVYTIRLDGTGLTRLTRSPYQELEPRWSPDGKRVVFHRRPLVAGPFAWGTVNVVNADGSDERQVLDTAFHDMDPDWSPNGSRILFSCDRFGRWAHLDICSVAPDGTGARLEVAVDGGSFGAWSPDGSHVAYMALGATTQSIWVASLDGAPPINLTPEFVSYMFEWSPDGTRLLLSIADASGFGLATVKRDGTGLVRLPVTPASGWASWSPDGRKVVTDLFLGATRALLVMNPDGSGQRVLEPVGSVPAYGALWSPNARPGAGLPVALSIDPPSARWIAAPIPAPTGGLARAACVQLPGREIPGRSCSTMRVH